MRRWMGDARTSQQLTVFWGLTHAALVVAFDGRSIRQIRQIPPPPQKQINQIYIYIHIYIYIYIYILSPPHPTPTLVFKKLCPEAP